MIEFIEFLAWTATRFNPAPLLYYWPSVRRFQHRVRRSGLKEGQNPLLLAVLRHAQSTVPWYRRHYSGLKLDSPTDIDRFETIDRSTLVDHFSEFISERIRHSHYELGTTGGTSGPPLKLLIPKNRFIVEWGTLFELWSQAGYHGQTRGVLRNHRLNNGPVRSRPLTREVLFDNFRLSDDYLGQIYDIIEKRKITFLHAYPSAAYRFASFLEKEKLPLRYLRVILSGSENIYPHYRTLIQERLGLRFYNWYGHAERLVLGGYCRNSDLYHIEPCYGHFELIDTNGRPVTKPGDTGEIVGTTLHNYGMPLIRYRTGDYAVYAGNYCPACRRTVPLLANIQGRWSGERIFRSDGSSITTTALNLHSHVLARIRGMQYEQDRPGQLLIRVVPGDGFGGQTVTELEAFYRDCLGDGAEVTILPAQELKRRANGKFLLLHKGLGN